MNKTIFKIFAGNVCLIVWLILVTAGFVCIPDADGADGKAAFTRACGQCHHAGGQAAVVNPADKAAIVWDKYFKRQRHPAILSQLISETEMMEIMTYLRNHAADSEQPVSAAIPQ